MKVLNLFFALLIYTNTFSNEYIIDISTKGINENTEIVLQVSNDAYQPKQIGSTKINNNKATFKGEIISNYKIAFIKISDIGSIPFILEKGNITISIELDSENKIKSLIGGSEQNIYFQKYNETSQPSLKKITDFQYENSALFQEASIKKDSITISKLIQNHNKLQDEFNQVSIDFIKNNTTAYISLLLTENLFLNGKLEAKEAKIMYEKFNTSLKQSKEGINLKKELFDKKQIELNDFAPNFEAPSPEGKTISLKESLGKVTIIDFWASWCAPCRKENPFVVKMYNELHSKGLNIIGVSLDKDESKWKEAIAKDGLTWPQISNLKFWEDPIATLYNISSIPATIVLDSNGKIVAKDLRGEALKAKIIKLLSN